MKKIALFIHRFVCRFQRSEQLTDLEIATVLCAMRQEGAKPWVQVKDEIGW